MASSLILCSHLAAQENQPSHKYAKVDQLYESISPHWKAFKLITEIDHSRLAEKAGATMPPAKVAIFSDTKVNSILMQINPMVGIDLPHKILVFSEGDTSKAKIATPRAAFLKKRHHLADQKAVKPLLQYDTNLKKILDGVPPSSFAPIQLETVKQGFGIITINSNFNFAESIQRIKKVVLSQGDTVWFADLNYQADAAQLGITIRPATLLLFGGPRPGAMAMAKAPKLGLDAFCQKLLVLEDGDGKVSIHYNSITEFAKLHYDVSSKPQEVINTRLEATFKKALSKPSK
ncbi:DUF302 domain-containing protein [Oceaniferula marina]|nr:DUF302 domain-containing protein [Oceaniferula marina]